MRATIGHRLSQGTLATSAEELASALLTWRQIAFRSMRKISAIATLLCMIACSGCAGKPVVEGWLDSRGTTYRESEQEDFGSRTTVKVRDFEF